ncbi:hippurate hydrolase [Cypionkella aquatica]|uniref:Hippurate hydrolase n=1 Tax=Cypionkella aquatica TaxID=1756042 RepID=A0AA37U2I8_9RHOB|nr:amidohydrolase [Cypionkella aquatica]GLS87256.1 hippurate hydrolase [Cypionkella aquatica]
MLAAIEAFFAEAVAWRRDFHQHPELSFAEHRTAARVAELLRSFGCDLVEAGIGGTGVVAVIHGRGPGRRIGLRADMDALPIHEASGVDFVSAVPGVMHACGHDGHTAMLLAAAKYLAASRDFAGQAVLIFQPGEEAGGGAKAMIADGVLARYPLDEVYALHNMPGLAVGAYASRPGPIMAAADMFEIVITGRGGHAAQPHLALDPVMIAGHVLVALQTVVSRNIDPLKPAVLSVSTVVSEGSGACVIPGRVVLTGTVRSFELAVQDVLEDRLRAVVLGVAAAHGGVATVDYLRDAPATVNDADCAAHALDVARGLSGAVEADVAPMMVSEDFSEFLNAVPGAFMFVGNGDGPLLHHPAYAFNDAGLPYGAAWLAEMVRARG